MSSYTSQQFLQADNSSAANWKAGLGQISLAIASMGWVQQNDTGQVVWTATVITLTQVTTGGGTDTYTYSSYTGPTPRTGMSVIVTGFVNGGNNSTVTITGGSFGASGTFTAAHTAQVNETHAGSATTTVTAVPTNTNFVYEIWAPGDALQTGATAFYLKVDYGTGSSASGVRLRMSLGTGTTGAGVLNGFTTTVFEPTRLDAAGSGTTTYDCYFSGDTNRLGMLLWRSRNAQTMPVAFAVERTKNTDGTDSSDGVSILVFAKDNSNTVASTQQTLVFGIGAGLLGSNNGYIALGNSQNASGAFNNNIPMSPIFPDYGKYGNPHTVVGFVHTQDVAEGCFFTTTLYGSTRTWIATANLSATVGNITNWKTCLRYD